MAGPVFGKDTVLVAIFQCAVNTKYCSVNTDAMNGFVPELLHLPTAVKSSMHRKTLLYCFEYTGEYLWQ